MPPSTPLTGYIVTYYCVYLGVCALLIAGLGWTFHRAGRVFLKDAFAGNTTLVDAVARLLDVGFYLVSVGYVVMTYSTYLPTMDLGWLLRIVSWKVGGLMLLLGIAHLFNLLLLALFRQRRAPGATAAGPEPDMPRQTPKSEETRQRILAAALRVFRERGFDAATMREIAAAAEVAVGAAYYYFASKDAIVMAFYQQAQDEMTCVLDEILNRSRTLEQRLRGIIDQKFEYFAPYRALVGTLSAHIDPAHPLSPFSKATAQIRERDIAFFRRAIAESKLRVPPSILPYLPRLLWLYQMGLMLFWVYDRSPRQARTHLLFDKTLSMMLLVFKLAGLPFLRPLHRTAAELLKAIYGDA